MKRTLLATFLSGLFFAPPATGHIYLPSTDDASTSNDVSRGPSSTNDRSDFVEFDEQTRQKRWRRVVAESRRLGDEFLALAEGHRIAPRVEKIEAGP